MRLKMIKDYIQKVRRTLFWKTKHVRFGRLLFIVRPSSVYNGLNSRKENAM